MMIQFLPLEYAVMSTEACAACGTRLTGRLVGRHLYGMHI